jgi:hypothetical protein
MWNIKNGLVDGTKASEWFRTGNAQSLEYLSTIKFLRPILQLLQNRVTAMMTKMSSTKRSSKGSNRRLVPNQTGCIQSHCGTQELIPAYQNIAWCSRVSRQDHPYTQPEPFEYMYLMQVALRSLSHDMSHSNLHLKESYPDADRYEE